MYPPVAIKKELLQTLTIFTRLSFNRLLRPTVASLEAWYVIFMHAVHEL